MCVRAERRLIKIRRMEGDACHLFLESFAYVSFALGVCIFWGIFFPTILFVSVGFKPCKKMLRSGRNPNKFFRLFFFERKFCSLQLAILLRRRGDV